MHFELCIYHCLERKSHFLGSPECVHTPFCLYVRLNDSVKHFWVQGNLFCQVQSVSALRVIAVRGAPVILWGLIALNIFEDGVFC